jgi:ribonuclease HI
MRTIQLFTDGAAKANPYGVGGYGIILQYTDEDGTVHKRELAGGTQHTTNNRMELIAVIMGLEELKEPCNVHVVSDSQYVINAINKGWLKNWQRSYWKTASNTPVKNKELWQRLLKSLDFHNVSFEWVKGHNGYPENERCDWLANQAAAYISKLDFPYDEFKPDIFQKSTKWH